MLWDLVGSYLNLESLPGNVTSSLLSVNFVTCLEVVFLGLLGVLEAACGS